jgi:hypothetical protein
MNLENLSPEEQKQLKEYLQSLREIKKEVGKLVNKCGYDLKEEDDTISTNSNTHNRSTGLIKKI